ncbi:hypothetical protein [Nitrospira sp. Kam-Ns4a]
MVPYIVIGAAALIGLVGWGLNGALLGAVLGWAVNMLIGAAVWLIYGGALPRKVRAQTATHFLDNFLDTAAAAYPGLSPKAMQKAIEADIERIARIAMEGAAAWQTGLEHDLVMAAAEKVVQEEEDPLRRELISALTQHLERTWYRSAQDGGKSGETLPLR